MKKVLIRYCSIYQDWNDDNIEKWNSQRQSGMFKFILIEGVIKWGVTAAFLFISLKLVMNDVGKMEIMRICFIWLVASLVYGYVYWVGTTASYENYVANNKKTHDARV
ncbi:hypothetical protein GCM10008107_14660 [Psychrosphaera saromensis]|uniref:Uncharacterized protein n=1 Tax=Psychrosphaera saromensis TaxID=716813 RepID=A0A2S7UVM1_9GAMM|nr:hypothetical protein [Psychrosphaera saromensis]PQJ53310.1 hypothetical protein BTO11_06275 [Psychrosphaera saromensis]GHB66507.1 hypothetical protein GCM10008107_14660 [Psychrosphaera saromensis]GLQ14922.1 hypothetical protein GCM10007917_23770 [Psychrosphaera saromensis]